MHFYAKAAQFVLHSFFRQRRMKKSLFVVISACLILHFVFYESAQSQTDGNAPRPAALKGKTFDGYTLFSSLFGNTIYLINMDGQVVHTWQMETASGFSNYFLDNGHILRSASRGGGMMGGGMMGGFGGRGGRGGAGAAATQGTGTERRQPGGIGAGGKIQEIDWEGKIVWEYEYATDTEVPHHDIKKMPNGNILLLCWDGKTAEESIAAGRNPVYQAGGEQNPDCIVEIKPAGDNKWEVVWKWYAWDHLIQDFDPNKPNYGKVSEHPELININYTDSWAESAQNAGQGNRRGGAGGMGGGMMGVGAIPVTDWTHLNAIDYNEKLDVIIVSSYTFSEIWIIDHGTTTEQAKSHTGGKHGKGGDLIYRYGNPAAYKQGTIKDKKFFSPHNIHWIEKGLPGEGRLLIFNNGPNRLDGSYSSVEEFTLPVDDKGNFKMNGKVFAAVETIWDYMDPNNKTNFYAMNISGAQRLPNGNTLICEGSSGHFFEVTSDKKIVWEYDYSTSGLGGGARGGGMMGGMMGGRGGAFGGAGGAGFGGAGGFGGMRGIGTAPADANSIAPADANSVAPQGQRGAGMRGQIGRAGGAGRGGARGGGMGGGFNMANQIFRAIRIPADHPALKGKDLVPETEN